MNAPHAVLRSPIFGPIPLLVRLAVLSLAIVACSDKTCVDTGTCSYPGDGGLARDAAVFPLLPGSTDIIDASHPPSASAEASPTRESETAASAGDPPTLSPSTGPQMEVGSNSTAAATTASETTASPGPSTGTSASSLPSADTVDAGTTANVDSSAPPFLRPGEACLQPSECESNFCSDGICCDTACDGVCSSCSVVGNEGFCQELASDDACGTLTCPASTECLTYSGEDLELNCASVDVCVAQATCTATPMASGTACQAGAGTCDGQGQCLVPDKKALGETCATDDECGQGHCVASASGTQVCCESACNGLCQACTLAGRCSATPADDAACATVDCPADTSCSDYPADRSTNRCASFGQCLTPSAYCLPTQASPGTNCGNQRTCDGAGSCNLNCPTTTGSGRTCTTDCPCGAGQGVCTNSNQCAGGTVCAAGAGTKFGFTGNTCVPAHCDNDVKDSTELSTDCGGECGCRATFEIVPITGLADGERLGELNAMSADGQLLVGSVTRQLRGWTHYPAVFDVRGAKTELESFGQPGQATAVSDDGSVIAGSLECFNPPACTTNTYSAFKWPTSKSTPSLYSTGSSNDFTTVRGLSSTGTYVVGDYFDASVKEGFRVNTSTSTFTKISGFSRVSGVTRDGLLVSGELASSGSDGLWSFNTGSFANLNLPTYWTAARIVDLNGTAMNPTMVGNAVDTRTDNTVPLVWRSGVPAELPQPSGALSTVANAVNVDGSVVIGLAYKSGSSGEAVVWVDGDVQLLSDELRSRGLELAPDLQLLHADFVSGDGKIIVGRYSLLDTSPSFWRVTLSN